MSYGLKRGTRHYIQYSLVEGEGWKDLIFITDEGQPNGLWSSARYGTANAKIEELMAECSTDRSQYRIVRRTWDETIIEHDPNYGKAFNDSDYYDPEQDPDNEKITETDEDADESYDGQDEDPEPPVNTPVANPLVK
jgi:hypothetical protein